MQTFTKITSIYNSPISISLKIHSFTKASPPGSGEKTHRILISFSGPRCHVLFFSLMLIYRNWSIITRRNYFQKEQRNGTDKRQLDVMKENCIFLWKHTLQHSHKLEFYCALKNTYVPSIYLDTTRKIM